MGARSAHAAARMLSGTSPAPCDALSPCMHPATRPCSYPYVMHGYTHGGTYARCAAALAMMALMPSGFYAKEGPKLAEAKDCLSATAKLGSGGEADCIRGAAHCADAALRLLEKAVLTPPRGGPPVDFGALCGCIRLAELSLDTSLPKGGEDEGSETVARAHASRTEGFRTLMKRVADRVKPSPMNLEASAVNSEAARLQARYAMRREAEEEMGSPGDGMDV